MGVGRRTAASPGSNSGVAHRGSNSGWCTEDVGPALPSGAPGLLGVLQPCDLHHLEVPPRLGVTRGRSPVGAASV